MTPSRWLMEDKANTFNVSACGGSRCQVGNLARRERTLKMVVKPAVTGVIAKKAGITRMRRPQIAHGGDGQDRGVLTIA